MFGVYTIHTFYTSYPPFLPSLKLKKDSALKSALRAATSCNQGGTKVPTNQHRTRQNTNQVTKPVWNTFLKVTGKSLQRLFSCYDSEHSGKIYDYGFLPEEILSSTFITLREKKTNEKITIHSALCPTSQNYCYVSYKKEFTKR